MIQAAKIIGTGIVGNLDVFIVFILVVLYLFIYLYYFPAYVSQDFGDNMVARLSACPHGIVIIAACTICTNMAHHFSTIANCTHSWNKLNYDANMVKNGSCDFAGDGSSHILHHAVTQLGDIAYYCSSCHAISCFNCVTG